MIVIIAFQALHISATKCIDHCRGAGSKFTLVFATKCSCGSGIDPNFNLGNPQFSTNVKPLGDCARSTSNQMIGDAAKQTVALYSLDYADPTVNATQVRKGYKVGPTTCLVGYELNSVMFGMDKLLMQADRDSIPKVQ